MAAYITFVVIVSICSLILQGYFVKNTKKDLARIVDAAERMAGK